MIDKILTTTTWGGFILGLTLADLYTLAGLICLIISILSSALNIIIKVKKAAEDGKITVDELNDIKKELDDLKHEIKK